MIIFLYQGLFYFLKIIDDVNRGVDFLYIGYTLVVFGHSFFMFTPMM